MWKPVSPSAPSHAAGRIHRYRGRWRRLSPGPYGRNVPAAASTQQEVRLYGAQYSVYTRIARLVLEECGVPYSLVEVDIFGAEDELPADYLRRHPFREQYRPLRLCSLSPLSGAGACRQDPGAGARRSSAVRDRCHRAVPHRSLRQA